MGVNLSSVVTSEAIGLDDLRGRRVAVDAFNIIYQFLSVIRQPDGTPLKDDRGMVTSHLSGLLYRTASLIESGVEASFVFDGVPHTLKGATVAKRRERRDAARGEWREALERGDMETARTKAQQSSRLTSEMVDESRELLAHMGVPVIQAPSEGESQAAYMAAEGEVWASSSQDFDSLLFGAPRLVRNLTLSGRRKLPGKKEYRTVSIELISLENVLSELSLTREQLVDVAILVGTDFHPGIKGIGPKRGIDLVRRLGDADAALEHIDKGIDELDTIRSIFLSAEHEEQYDIEPGPIDRDAVRDMLCDRHGFSEGRVKSALDRMERGRSETEKRSKQKSLDMWF